MHLPLKCGDGCGNWELGGGVQRKLISNNNLKYGKKLPWSVWGGGAQISPVSKNDIYSSRINYINEGTNNTNTR